MIPIRMSTIFHHPLGHHRVGDKSGEADAKMFCCMVRSNYALPRKAESVAISFSSVLKLVEIDLGSTLVRLQVAVRRIVEQDRRMLDESVVKGPLQINLLVA